MNPLPFDKLRPHKKRAFVPEKTDLGDWSQIAPLFDRLEAGAAQSRTAPTLERWLLDWGELNAALDEEGARRYVAMTCHTDNADAEKDYLHFVEQIEPRLKPRQFRLEELYLQHPLRGKLATERYAVFDRATQVRVDLYRAENVPLETEEARLSQQYQKLCGSLTVAFRGEEKTLAQMAPYLEEPDRALRKETWELVATRRLREAEKFEDIFDRLVALREQIARNAGFANYRDYAFRWNRRFDYTPNDCLKFHDAIEREVMPMLRDLQTVRRGQLKLDKLQPWDLAVDPLNRPPLRPFGKVDQMVSDAQRIFNQLDGELSDGFKMMNDLRLLDLDNRKGKAPGGYQTTLAEARLP
ncbi:MAG TPA: M3 family metallopeptidase, partial [Candidatus Angelobacter sp.]|nr:M3 family metallopeptidase [Candidatus Angelobacter sp.]